jgi:hypothetical protein
MGESLEVFCEVFPKKLKKKKRRNGIEKERWRNRIKKNKRNQNFF